MAPLALCWEPRRAIVARTLGEGRKELAQEYFSMLIYTVLVVGGILSVVSVVLTEPIARAGRRQRPAH